MSAQRRSERKRTATRINELDSSPTQRPRPAPKKRKANPPARRPARRQKIEDDVEHEIVNNETEEEEDDSEMTLGDDPQCAIENAVRYLNVSSEEVEIAKEFKEQDWNANENIQAFAKISGREWTYFVNDMRIYIGRDGNDAHCDDGLDDDPSRVVHIDLGPSKVISRRHAEIYYDSGAEDWYITVHGRNGVRKNEELVKRNTGPSRISGGDILDIGGTQMLFQPADQLINLPQFFLNKIDRGRLQSEDASSSAARPKAEMGPANGKPVKQNGNITSTPSQNSERPKTPEPLPKREPTASGKKKLPKRSPNLSPKRTPYKRGMVMDSTEQIDYSLDSSKDIKPACSYASMITWAILSTPEEAISLNNIYNWIKTHYAYYRLVPSGWQNSIRHNLSLSQSFQKVPRRQDEPGKGMKWTFVPEKREEVIATANKQAGGGRNPSVPASPAGVIPPQGGFAIRANNQDVKTSPTQPTPPLSSYPPTQQQTSTPTHENFGEPNVSVYGPTRGPPLPVLSDETSPVAKPFHNGRLANLSGSSPTLTFSYGNADLPTHTPAPRPFNLSLPQPNTAKLPTSHMTPTTPAPFWKPFHTGLGSTPARWPDSSPAKNGGALPMSSSPPPIMGNGVESPTRKGGSSQPQKMSSNFGFSSSNGNSALDLGDVASSSVSAPTVTNGDEEQEGGIDLLKGFTKISTFHAPQKKQMSSAQAH